MSEIRGCDNCGNIFSVRQVGWGTAPVTRFVMREGRRVQDTEQLDFCKNCYTPPADDGEGPQLKIPGMPDYAKIRELETDLGIGKDS